MSASDAEPKRTAANGLPAAALARLERAGRSGVRTSMLPVPGAVGLHGVGLEPVGEVMGCIVEQIGWSGWGGCGYYGSAWGGFGNPIGTITSGAGGGFAAYRPYVDALYRGYDSALSRMTAEAAALGADGVVGVRLTVGPIGGAREFVALGTAVRARGDRRPSRPFTTVLAGQDVAKLMLAGWVPVAVTVGISVAVRHDDYRTRAQASAWQLNTEVSGYTELVTHVRADARARFESRAGAAGADCAVVDRMDLRIWAHEAGEGHTDHVAEADVFGTSIARFAARTTAPTGTLTVLPLRRI